MRRDPSTACSPFLRAVLFVSSGMVLALAAGCAPPAGRPILFASGTGYLAAVLIDAASEGHPYCKDCRASSDIPVYPPGPVRYDAPPLPASARDQVPTPREGVAFDARRARSTLAAIDLSSCRELGAPRGYGHAIVTYSAEGFPAKVVIDDPAGLSERAVACVGDKLGAANVTAFDGAAAPVGVTWFIP